MIKILRLAIPSIISNLTVPLLGLLDVVIVGHLSNPSFIGAIAVGGMMFTLLYWGFGFLRMGTGGLTAQAFGREDRQDIQLQLIRPLLIAGGVSLCIWALQRPLEDLILFLIGEGDKELRHWASVYFRICVWGAPAVLSLYAFNGWFVGLQRPKITMYIALIQNLSNMVLSLFFVYQIGMQVEGVALGTLLAQWIGLLIAVIHVYRLHFFRDIKVRELLHHTLDTQALTRYFNVNKHIFGRTMCLIAVTSSFTSFGARQGEELLAVNTLMMQLFTIFSYIMDGFAYAGESLSGAYYGAGETKQLRNCVHKLFLWGWIMMAAFTLIYSIGGMRFLSLLTNQPTVLASVVPYIEWAMLIPICSFAAFVWDGIFIGMTLTRQMFLTCMAAMVLYFGLYLVLFPYWGNHGLWIAFLSYLALRGIGQWFCFRRVQSLKLSL